MTVTSRRFLYLATALVAVNSFFWIAQSGFALPKAIINQFFGGNMIRAEAVVATAGGTQDWRIDRGVITAISGTDVTLRERDATVVSLQLDPNARVQGPARFSSVPQLRRRLRVVLYRQADQPVSLVQVEGVSG
ncbi:MAG: hypothetical protein QOF27_1329 [Gaiellaceae bacterium]|jgi:hypothetical protein|nr:hypothetical protein [Gaiellaceae bacterium]MDX6440862.1 hypothetical protein [Gaiellaceae bacterium]